MDAANRQDKIKQLIENEVLEDQKQIVDLLWERYQISTNQAVVSRDLRKLGVVKRAHEEGFCYELPNQDVESEILKLGISHMTFNEVMIVIKTRPGLAPFVGDCIDLYFSEEIAGCISGENTIFVSPRSIKGIESLFKKIASKLHFKIS